MKRWTWIAAAAFADDPRVDLSLHEGLNHLSIAGKGPPGPSEYVTARSVDPAVNERIAAWVIAAPAK